MGVRVCVGEHSAVYGMRVFDIRAMSDRVPLFFDRFPLFGKKSELAGIQTVEE